MKKITRIFLMLLLCMVLPMEVKAENLNQTPEEIESGLAREDYVVEMADGTSETSIKPVCSILGDSLGTYRGYTPIYYQHYCQEEMPVSSTWWMHYIESNNMCLGINESLGGSKVAWWNGEPSGYAQNQCMASQERIDNLAANGTPDTILFFGGTNDVGSTPLGTFLPGQNIGVVDNFSDAYQTAVFRLKKTYPNAKIICITPYYRSEQAICPVDDYVIDEYDNRILEICNYYGIMCLDLRNANLDFGEDMCAPDWFHVNTNGMNKIWHMLQYQSPAPVIDGIAYQKKDEQIDVGVAYSDTIGRVDCKWLAYNLDQGQWETITDWYGGNWASWTPAKGNYWLQAQVRDETGMVVTKTICFYADRGYPVYIIGKYQGPNPNGAGTLIGISTNKNPNSRYKYEMLVLDCQKYTQGDPNPWIYGTGLCYVENGTTFWATYNPEQHGYFWTYFRVYDEKNRLVDDQCYGTYM